MRLHRLRINAFGPFANTVEVNFDAVTDAGLFLVHGATGAGKSSLLDAITFALYSEIPGMRATGAGLRSHHAAQDAVPSVELEFSVDHRRLRVSRQPAFQRPGRSTLVPAKVSLAEYVAGAWQTLSTRADETGDLLNDLMGMGRAQFEKVVLLPQGQCAAFLIAKPQERRVILERLFDVQVYTGIERFLTTERSRSSRKLTLIRQAHDQARGELSEAHAAATALGFTPPPAEHAALESTKLVMQQAALAESLHQWQAALHDAETAAADNLAQATTRLEAVLDLARLQRAGATALEALAHSEAAATEIERMRSRLRDAERAAGLEGYLRALTTLRAEEQARTHSCASALEQAHTRFGLGLDDDTVKAVSERLAAGLDLLKQLAGLARTAQDHQQQVNHHTHDMHTAQRELDNLNQAASRNRSRNAELSHAQEQRAAIAGEREQLGSLESTLERRLSSREGLDAALGQLAHARADAERLTDHYHQSQEHYLNVRQAHLDGLASILATELTDGCPCPVCGSPEHPQPALADETPSQGALTEAENQAEHARAAREHARRVCAGLTSKVDTLTETLADETRNASQLRAALALARERAGQAAAATLEHERGATELASVEQQHQQILDRLHLTHQRVAAAQAQVEAFTTLRENLTAQLKAGIAEHHQVCPCAAAAEPGQPADIAALVESHQAATAALDEFAAATSQLAETTAHRVAAERDLERALADTDLLDESHAAAALLAPEARTSLSRAVAEHDSARLSAQTTLEQDDIKEALALPAADVETARVHLEQCRQTYENAIRGGARADKAVADITHRTTEFAQAASALTAAEAQHAILAELADAVSGTGENTLRMPLPAFVLAARLERVIQLANERLDELADGRYHLRHTDTRAKHGAKSGLGIDIIDQWTGVTRASSTLSGGESFMASLALALALADAVREESGAITLETLFIDEGFGTLDDESLEQVLNVLDTLHDRGRAVGVVSHVSDLKSRIPRQIHVIKGRDGSRVKVIGDEADPKVNHAASSNSAIRPSPIAG